ncbi:PQQ-dependent sugar dehydrogenase [Candidatus Curtissbacteria bacterium]|nr:PQQ-dependent sugar dehydrogenase [Candidatus Curtissbacteria bacterium]
MTKTISIIIAIAIISFVIFKSNQFKGALPSILPPKELPQQNQLPKEFSQTVVKNDLGLTLAAGFSIDIFAKDLGNARDLEFSPEGTLLVSTPAQGKILALPDKDGDGKSDSLKTVIAGLSRPHGIAFYQGKLFIAEETKVARYNWDETNLSISLDKNLFDLPNGGRHFTRTIAFDNSGRMYISIGSTCDVCFEKNEWLAAVIVSDKDGNSPRLFAKGLRNSVFITVNPKTQDLWGTEMGRDFLGDDLPPDEINIIEDGKDYGWPICYGNKIHDTQFDKNQYVRDPCEDTVASVYNIPAHSAPLGLTFINSSQFPESWQGDLLVAYHGSWNRSTPVGYKVVRVKIEGETSPSEEDFLSGFLSGSQTIGRPVDLALDKKGSLFISDDKAGLVYRAWRN